MVTDELFVKAHPIERYETSVHDMLSLADVKLASSQKEHSKKAKTSFDVFLSYCRQNSQDAIDKGTPLRSENSLGWADPRSLKTYLEKEAYSVWVDFEQVGAKKTLFEDIVEGNYERNSLNHNSIVSINNFI